VEAKLVIAGTSYNPSQPNQQLCKLIAQARLWYEQLASGKMESVRSIALREKVHETEISRALPLAFLAPAIVEAILQGRHPEELTVKKLRRSGGLPDDWASQHKLLGIPHP